jgi:3-dehydroquinate synthase
LSENRDSIGREKVVFSPISRIRESFGDLPLLIVTDCRLAEIFGTCFPASRTLIVPEGEKAKSWEALSDLLAGFVNLGVDRSWNLLALGGGSVSDLAGLASHIWMRGISFFCAPTTLLSMVDASLGGKNGIDFMGFKNVLGSFQRPKTIFCDVSALLSLDSTQFASGMAEAIKHAVIDGEPYFPASRLCWPKAGVRDPFPISSAVFRA